MNKVLFRIVLLLFLFCAAQGALAQTGTIKGKIVDGDNKPIADALVAATGTSYNARSDAEGLFRLTLPVGRYALRVSHPSFQAAVKELEVVDGRTYDMPVKLLPFAIGEIEIIGQKDPSSIDDRSAMLISPIRMDKVAEMPVVAPSVESLMRTMPGVASNNEFSSQYQVRGGNFDENLVYVNGIEIYRPFLTRSGQQEGLGFSNPSMAQSLAFSTGGFGAIYGDKLSSVLDITYRQPRGFRATVEAGIISTNLHAEGITKNRKNPNLPGRFTWLMGARRFQMAYLLNSLNTRGDYRPSFLDYQGMFTFTPSNRNHPERIRTRSDGSLDTVYIPNEKYKLTAFISTTRNRYRFEPTGAESTIGTLTDQVFRIRTGFEGREITGYNTGLAALMGEYKPSTRLSFNAILSGFRTEESELIDVEGGYLIGEVNTNFGSDEFNESEFDLGIGSIFRHARNYLTAQVLAAEVNGKWSSDNDVTHRVQFGLKVQQQYFNDILKEYALLDSAGYVVDSTGKQGLDESIRGTFALDSRFYKAYVQHDWQIGERVLLTYGARLIYYDLNQELMFSPRGQLLVKLKEEKDGETRLRLRFAAGMYHQPPFYREFRRTDGSVNLEALAQRSLHLITGLEYRFMAWNRPFHLFAEGYYKRLYNIIPYEVENVRVRYYPDLSAKGYAYGLDARLNGEFIRGIDSWVSIGLLKTSEDVAGDEQGYVARPSDQRFSFAMYFQDELPTNPTYKVHVNYVYGSGMRFGPPRTLPLRTYYTFPSYHRVDIGFSKMITFKSAGELQNHHGIESIWATVEIYNLLQRENTVSYTWIKDLQNRRFAVPNYLSARLINVRVVFKFR
ncbi:MAG: TonB-dependent receptor [Bacteroidetes bacterium]|nr:MAG: TonB-dependent receptor [Bacteroidota bacterium]